jgi:excinuclease ABC subunit C
MTRDHVSITKLPDSPGVYFFIGPKKNVLYVGKATSLKDRVRSYFSTDLVHARGAHIVSMVAASKRVEFRATDSVLEALILEAKLIKNFKPPYNTRDKDDKSFNYLIITTHEAYPRLLTVRGKDIATTLHGLRSAADTMRQAPLPVYGPFPHATQFKEALVLIRKIFPYYDTARPVDELRALNDRKLRFNESIGVYPHPETTSKDYARTIRHIRLFLDGKKPQLLRTLERDMAKYARLQKFEEASVIRRQLFALRHINDVSLLRRSTDERSEEAIRIEGYDVAHLSGKDMVGVMTVVEGGETVKKEYRTFTIRSVDKSNDTQALTEMLSRRLGHPEWTYPKLIVVDGGKAQLNAARTVMRRYGVAIPVVAVTKDERHRPRIIQGHIKMRDTYERDILLVNAEAHRFSLAMHTKKRTKRALM